MKKWLLTCLFVLLATLLCTACAEDEHEHKWYWKKVDFTNHVKFCEICGVPDRTSTAKQDESYAWPDEPPKDSDVNPEQVLTGPIKCSVCGWGLSQSFSAETSQPVGLLSEAAVSLYYLPSTPIYLHFMSKAIFCQPFRW